MKRYQKTVRCPRCNTSNIFKARETKTGITFNGDYNRINCLNCGERILLPIDIGYPWREI